MAMPAWWSEVQVVSSVAIAFGVACIGYRQYLIAAQKLKLDLYQKRWDIYTHMIKLSGRVSGNVRDREMVRALLSEGEKKTWESRFVLDEAGYKFILDLYQTIYTYVSVSNDAIADKSGLDLASKADHVRENSKILQHIRALTARFPEEFERFLKLENIDDHGGICALPVRLWRWATSWNVRKSPSGTKP